MSHLEDDGRGPKSREPDLKGDQEVLVLCLGIRGAVALSLGGDLTLYHSCRQEAEVWGNLPGQRGLPLLRRTEYLSFTYYCRLTPNCWVGRGGRGGGVLVGGGGWPLCRFCSFSSYLWTQQESVTSQRESLLAMEVISKCYVETKPHQHR